MLGIPPIHPKGLCLPTVVGQFDDFDVFISDSSVRTPSDPFELSFLPLDEKKFCFIKCLPCDEAQYAAVMAQTQNYEIRIRVDGNMTYRMRQAAEEDLTIRPEIMLVKDGQFAGILVYCSVEEEAYMHTQSRITGYGVIFTDNTRIGMCQSHYSMHPGNGWYSVSYELVPRTNASEGIQE